MLAIILLLCILSAGMLYSHREKEEKEISWAYQLQNASVEEIIHSEFRIFVMDYSRDGTPQGIYSQDEIKRIRDSGIIVLAYLSIGEAEDYRWYWNDSWIPGSPPWLGEENPQWQGNYAVKFWDHQWQEIVMQYLNTIISQGFSGVYLDKVDEFEYWMERGIEDAPYRMASFIENISDYARSISPDFLIVPQNGEDILDYTPQLAGIVSGWAAEDVFYNGLEKNPEEEVSWRVEKLQKILKEGKFVLSVDYVDDGSGFSGANRERIMDYISLAREHGFIPYAALNDRELDEINIIPGVQPG